VDFLVALVPSAGMLLIFWLVIKALIEGDRRERAAEARMNVSARRAVEQAPAGTEPADQRTGPAGQGTEPADQGAGADVARPGPGVDAGQG
jgi:hypothetical protein